MQGFTSVPPLARNTPELRFESEDKALERQAFWRRMLPISAVISYGLSGAVFLLVYFSAGYPPSATTAEAAFLTGGLGAGILSLLMFNVGRRKAVSTIAVNGVGVTLSTVQGSRQTLRWDDPSFRIVLWNRGPSLGSPPSSDDVGVLNAPRALVAWPTAPARDTIFRVAREHGLRIWTWRPWSLYTEFPTTSLVAHRLSFTDRLRGLRARRPDP